MQEMILRMQTLLTERIDRTHQKLIAAEERASQLQIYEAEINALKSELEEMRKAAGEQEIRSRKIETENAILLKQVPLLKKTVIELENSKRASEGQIYQLRDAIQRLTQELGRTVKVFLPNVRGGLYKKKLSLAEKARMLISNDIIDPVWYLEHHSDVAAAGMDAATHYILHGAGEGRAAKPFLNEKSQGSD
ncbi:MAG: hypothetical protein E6Q77_11280 [Rhizobium sp.]|nr:MAG: hypothetical protein E6Q77_11280 [Rhizobium sp.]